MRALLDTSVLIADSAPNDVEAAISVVSITELHFGLLLARDDDERARRTDRLAVVEATFDPLLITAELPEPGVGWRPRSPCGVASPADVNLTWRSQPRQWWKIFHC